MIWHYHSIEGVDCSEECITYTLKVEHCNTEGGGITLLWTVCNHQDYMMSQPRPDSRPNPFTVMSKIVNFAQMDDKIVEKLVLRCVEMRFKLNLNFHSWTACRFICNTLSLKWPYRKWSYGLGLAKLAVILILPPWACGSSCMGLSPWKHEDICIAGVRCGAVCLCSLQCHIVAVEGIGHPSLRCGWTQCQVFQHLILQTKLQLCGCSRQQRGAGTEYWHSVRNLLHLDSNSDQGSAQLHFFICTKFFSFEGVTKQITDDQKVILYDTR